MLELCEKFYLDNRVGWTYLRVGGQVHQIKINPAYITHTNKPENVRAERVNLVLRFMGGM